MMKGLFALLLMAVLPPPMPVLVACFVFAYFLVRELFEGWSESRGHDPGRAQRRHAERMQRLEHAHERWKAGHQLRLARFSADHPRIGRALQARLARWIEGAGTQIRKVEDQAAADATPRRWRAACRRAWQRMSATLRAWIEATGTRITGPDPEEPIEPADEKPPAVEEPREEQAPVADPPTAEPPSPPPPQDPAPTEAVPAAKPATNVVPLFAEGKTMTTASVELASGQTVNPQAGLQFTDSVITVLSEVHTRTRNSVDILKRKHVKEDQVADWQEFANLLNAAIGKAQTMNGNFSRHLDSQASVATTGAGTHEGYLEQR